MGVAMTKTTTIDTHMLIQFLVSLIQNFSPIGRMISF